MKQPNKIPIRPNVMAGLMVFLVMVVSVIIVVAINPDALTSEFSAFLMAALAILGGLFSNLMKSEEDKDDGLSAIAHKLVANGNHNPPAPAPVETPKPKPFPDAPEEAEPEWDEEPQEVFVPAKKQTEPTVVITPDNPAKPWSPPGNPSQFNDAFNRTLKHEGEWLLSKEPDGTRVYSGINEKANPDWAGWQHLPAAPNRGHKTVDTPELRELTKERYRKSYWEHPLVVAFHAYAVLCEQVYDCHVHGGAAWRLQETCVKLGEPCGKDGLWGPGTEAACAAVLTNKTEQQFNNALVDCRKDYITRAVRKKMFPKEMAKGLRNRAESYRMS